MLEVLINETKIQYRCYSRSSDHHVTKFAASQQLILITPVLFLQDGSGKKRFNIDLIARKLASECLSETQRPPQQKCGSFAHVWPSKRLFVHEAERGS